jgi:hypothetical protein
LQFSYVTLKAESVAFSSLALSYKILKAEQISDHTSVDISETVRKSPRYP